MVTPMFYVNQKVFAKIRGYPPWPGKIQNFYALSNKIQYSVYLYGFDIDGKFQSNKLMDFSEYVLNHSNFLSAQKLFIKALDEVQRDVKDGSKNNSSLQSISKIINKCDRCEDYDARMLFQIPRMNEKLKLQRLSNKDNLEHTILILENHLLNHTTAIRSKSQICFRVNEIKLLFCDYEIKSNLTSSQIKYKNVLSAMNHIQTLKLSKRVLKKHPQLLDTVSKLRKYDGNDYEWKRKHKTVLQSDCSKIRAKANQIYNSFKKVLAA